MTELLSTLRLQFHKGFTLHDAKRLIPYFEQLGVSHLYASPLLTARPGSMHGYDVIDPSQINPELGGEAALVALADALHEHGMGLILDIVSNHMAVGGDANPWWLDVLEWGRNSPFAGFFDIQWNSHDPLLEGQLLVPFLRSDYGEALSNATLVLHFDEQCGSFYVEHFEHRLPITPPSYGDILGASENPALTRMAQRFAALGNDTSTRERAKALCAELAEWAQTPAHRAQLEALLERYRLRDNPALQRLHRLLERQHYRVASWRTAADDINWRRFFDINELAGLRVERPQVFEKTHAKIFELIERGLIDGLRIDHIDGLANPRTYCKRLQRRIQQLRTNRASSLFPIYVEKILGHDEHLPLNWAVAGTTGYEFMNQVSLLQHDPRGEQPLRELWQALSNRPGLFQEEVLQARRLVLTGSLAGDLEEVAQRLLQVARNDIATRDLTLGSIRRALLELIVHFPVYRTYAQACGRSEQDQQIFCRAQSEARTTLPEADWPLLEHLERWLGGEPLYELPPGRRRTLRAQVLTRFQQLTSPAAAKAVEDTAFYRTGVLLSRYDVGFDAEHFSRPPADFHQSCVERAKHHPHNLLSTATHDHKRGEDSRARLAVLSERAPWYRERVRQWSELSLSLRPADAQEVPIRGEELILYQALLGSWPLDLAANDEPGLHNYLQRMSAWQEKALREAKLSTAWSAPNELHESACRDFLECLLTSPKARELRHALVDTLNSIAPSGALNSLVQCLLRLTTPGVPDLYQGCEYWDFSLVDPDNRRPVDFAARMHTLDDAQPLSVLLEHWRDGRIKQWLIQRLLRLRQNRPALFSRGDYRPVAVQGEHIERVLAFIRSHGQEHMLVVVPRLSAGLLDNSPIPLIPAQRWGDTHLLLPPDLSGCTLMGTLSPCQIIGAAQLPVAQLLTEFSANVLCSPQHP
ncbi:malto-oligosyltrehalose synthase [Pseudomonas sp. EA_35y_Pfl2_R5]|uniref:malto-oligosyltrehalose synthase n=1 Tax=Pseudomonas sp. EA_35y_Pfl2_R5 TaxID=3088690 RepID=UPI0030D84D7B